MRYAVAAILGAVLVAQPSAQDTDAAPRFEVASVKPSDPSVPLSTGLGWQVTPTRFTARNVPLFDYLVSAFNTDRLRLVMTASIRSERFDIVATGSALNPNTVRTALRILLEERFAVRAHRETRDMDVQVLVLADAGGRLGPNLRRVSVDCNAPSNKGACGWVSDGAPSFGFKGVDWKGLQFALALSHRSKSGFMIDRTGLDGQFDLLLKWRSEDFKDAANPENLSRPRFEDALREQLGLKLVPSREAIEVVVIDSVERPTPD